MKCYLKSTSKGFHKILPIEPIPKVSYLYRFLQYNSFLEIVRYIRSLIISCHNYYPFLSDALEKIQKAAKHSNEAIKKLEKFQELMIIQQRLGDIIELVSPTRELVKEGDLQKISGRSKEHETRHVYLVSSTICIHKNYLVDSYWANACKRRLLLSFITQTCILAFQFNDMLLLCSERAGVLNTEKSYRVRTRFDVGSMVVSPGEDGSELPIFHVSDEDKEVMLYTA